MTNGQLPEEARDLVVEQLMQEMFPSVLPVDDGKALYHTPTVFIGCGGTGKGIVREVKRRVQAVFPDNPLYQFVVFDTDPRYAEEFDANEFHYLGNFDPALVVHPTAPASVIPWWPRGFIPAGGIIDDGARTIRMLGRLALFHNINLICNAISTAIRNALDYFRARFQIPAGQASIHAYIISSISGGTGSGLYLDIAYITQELCKSLGVQSSHLVGVLGLPNIFENTLNLSIAERKAIEANSYAALEELDHFMSGAGFRCDYGAIRVNSQNPPFNMVYLFGASNAVGLMLNKRETVFAMVGAALQLEAASVISLTHAASYAFKEGRWGQVGPDRAFYSSLAAGSITFPADLVIQYCGLKLAQEMLSQLQSQVDGAGSDAQAFVDSNNLNEDGPGSNQVQEYLSRDDRGQKLSIITPPDDLAQRVPADHNAGAAMRRAIQDNENLFGEYDKVIRTRAGNLLDQAKKSLVERVAKIASDPSMGPAYASQFLSDLANLLQAYSGQMQQESQQLEADLQQQVPPVIARYMQGGAIPREESWARMVEEAVQRGRLFRGTRVAGALRKVASDMNQYYATRLHIVLLQQSKALFDRLLVEVEGLQRNMQHLLSNIANLKAQIVKQLKSHENRIRALPQQQSVALSIVDFDAVERLYALTKPADLKPLITRLLHNLKPTTESSMEQIAASVLQVAIEPFQSVKKKGLVEIARLVYPENWQKRLDNLVSDLFTRALHPFWSYRKEYPGVTDHRSDFCFVALPAGEQFLSDLFARRPEPPQQIPISNPHTLIVLYLEHNIPLSPLTMLPQLYESYEDMLHDWLDDRRRTESGQQNRAQYPPLHLHRDWHKFPDVLPPTQMAGRLKTFVLAEAYGIIQQSDSGEFFLTLARRKSRLGATRAEARRRFLSEGELVAHTDAAIRAYEDRFITNPGRLLKQLQSKIEALSMQILRSSVSRRALTQREQDEMIQMEEERNLLQGYLTTLLQDMQQIQSVLDQGNQKPSKSRGARKPAGRSKRQT